MERELIVRQLSIFLDNRPGSLAGVLRWLSDHGVDLRALSVTESRDFGTVRIIVGDPDAVADVLGEGDYHFSEVDVLAVEVPDRPGGMAEVAEDLAAERINIEYAYTMVVMRHDKALLVMRVDELPRAAAVLKSKGRRVLTAADVAAL